VITKGKRESSTNEYGLKHLSYSALVAFGTNPIMFKIRYKNGDTIDTLQNISGVVGKAFHLAMQVYFGGHDEYVISNESEAIQMGMQAGVEYIEAYNDGWIDFSSTIPTKQKAIEKFIFLFQSYIKEQNITSDQILLLEGKLEYFIDVEYKGEQVKLPVKLKGYLDKVFRDKKGRLCIKDYKTVVAFSKPDKIDGAKMLQSAEYFFLAYAEYGEIPYKIVFEEVKMTQNQDRTKPQVQSYEIIYEENQLFFDFYFRYYNDVLRGVAGESVYVPNVNAMYDNEVAIVAYIHRLDDPEEVAKKLRENQVKNITELLKSEIDRTSSMKAFLENTKKEFQTYKSLNYETMTIEERIKTKYMEFGLLLNFDSKVEGLSVTQYRFNPSIGVKMKTLESHIKDVEQVVGKSDIRILAPIPNTSFVGFEIPNEDRTFISQIPKGKGFNIAIGEDILGKTRFFDPREAPHMLIAGATGSGKSVFLNNFISQLQKVSNVELHLFDPKQVELAHFQGSQRVVEYASDPEKIHYYLEGLINEMEYRYGKLKMAGVKNIEKYDKPMKYKFVVIDEFGDLIVSNHIKVEYVPTGKIFQKGENKGQPEMERVETNISKEIEKYILILGQKARACGIHVIISTQRPSVNIVSGSIKNNFPVKVAFRMSRAIDSQVAIDMLGAEKLLGKGDMLFIADKGVERLQGYSD